MPINAVFFDIGNVLLRWDMHGFLGKVAGATGKAPDDVFEFLVSNGIEDRYERGNMTSRDFFTSFITGLGFKGLYKEFLDLWCGNFYEIPEMKTLFLEYKKHKKVYMLSNTNELHYNYLLEHFPFLGLADGAVLSYQAGARKPEPAIYHHAVRKAAVPPKDILFIDDMPANVEAARKEGIRAFRFTGDVSSLKKEIKSLRP